MTTTNTTEPGFVKGGLRRADQTAALPPVHIVEHGSVYRDEDGRYWMAWVNNSVESPRREWMPARRITTAESLHLRTMHGFSGLLAIAAIILFITALITGFITHMSVGSYVFLGCALVAVAVAIGMAITYDGKLHLTFTLGQDGTPQPTSRGRA